MDMDEMLRDRYRNARVCRECVGEPELRDYIASADGEPGCSFCDGDDAPTCVFLDFMDHVRECIEAGYDLAAKLSAMGERRGRMAMGSGMGHL